MNRDQFTQLPPEIFCCILGFLPDFNEKIQFCTQISKFIQQVMIHDECSSLGLFRMLCYDLKERELLNLFSLMFEKRKEVELVARLNPSRKRIHLMLPVGMSMSKFRKVLLDWIDSCRGMFPELVENHTLMIVEYWERSINIWRDTMETSIDYSWTLKEKNIFEELKKRRQNIKQRNWKSTLRGMIFQKRTHELNFIVKVLPIQLFSQKNKHIDMDPMIYYSKLVDLLKLTETKKRHHIMFQEKYGPLDMDFLASVLYWIRKSSTRFVKSYSGDKKNVVLSLINYFLDEGFQYYGNNSFICSRAKYSALSEMVEIADNDLLINVLTCKLAHFKFDEQVAFQLCIKFIKRYMPIDIAKKCLVDTGILSAPVILSGKDNNSGRSIAHYIVIINAKNNDKWEYFRDWIELISDVIIKACNNQELENNNYKTNLLALFGSKKNARFSPVEFLQETITQSANSNQTNFKKHIEHRVGVSIRPLYRNMVDYHTNRKL